MVVLGEQALAGDSGSPGRRSYLFESVLVALLLAVSSFFSPAVGRSLTADSLEIQLSMSAKEYFYGQEIYATVSVINRTDDSLQVLSTFLPTVLKLIDEIGTQRSMENIRFTMGGIGSRSLAPRETLLVDRRIHSYYYAYEDPAKKEFILGPHTLRAEFGPFVSKTVEYEVLPNRPSDDEIVAVLGQACRSWFEPSAYTEMTERTQAVLRNSLGSIYEPELLFALRRLALGSNDDSLEVDSSKRLVTEYPNHGYAQILLVDLSNKLDPDARSDFFDSVVRDHPNTRAAKWIRQYRKSMGSE